jgi:hypothetical protein
MHFHPPQDALPAAARAAMTASPVTDHDALNDEIG